MIKKIKKGKNKIGRFGVRTPETFFPIGKCSRQEAERIAVEKGGTVVLLELLKNEDKVIKKHKRRKEKTSEEYILEKCPKGKKYLRGRNRDESVLIARFQNGSIGCPLVGKCGELCPAHYKEIKMKEEE